MIRFQFQHIVKKRKGGRTRWRGRWQLLNTAGNKDTEHRRELKESGDGWAWEHDSFVHVDTVYQKQKLHANFKNRKNKHKYIKKTQNN